ncbi:MAG: PE domain-containing protein [Mycobacteriaceae bacterium]
MANVMIADIGDGQVRGGSVSLAVAPLKLREASERLAALADNLELKAVARLNSTHVEPCGLDEVSVTAAGWYNRQINGGPGSGLWAISQAVQNLRDSAAALGKSADAYEKQNNVILEGFKGAATQV